MSIKTAKIIRIVLLVLASILLFVGISLSREFERMAASDVTRIKASVTNKKSYENSNGDYCIDFDISVTNKAKVTWSYLNIIIHVFDKSHSELGTITSTLGNSSDLNLKRGQTKHLTTTLTKRYLDDTSFVGKLYNSAFSDFIFEVEVTQGDYRT